MKKFMKAFAVLSAMAMLAGSFVSCSSDDDSGSSKPAATTYKCSGCNTEYATEAEKNNCGKQSGCPKYGVTTYTCSGCNTAYDTEAEKDNCAKQSGCPKYVAPATYSTYSWDLLTATVSDITGYKQTKEVPEGAPSGTSATGTYFATAVTALDAGPIALTTEKTIACKETGYNLVLAAFNGTGTGTSKAGSEIKAYANYADKTDADTTKQFVVTTENLTTAFGPALACMGWSDKGLYVKRDVMKIPSVKGKAKLTIKWYLNSTSNRNLEVTIGTDGTTVATAAGTTKGACPDYVVNFDGGTEGKDVFIGASNDLYIQSIELKIED